MKALQYSLKIWLTGITASSVIATVYFASWNDGATQIMFDLLTIVTLALVASVPSFLLLWLMVHVIAGKDCIAAGQKLLLSGISIVLTLLPFSVLGKELISDAETIGMLVAYAAAMVAGVWFYDLKYPAHSNVILTFKKIISFNLLWIDK